MTKYLHKNVYVQGECVRFTQRDIFGTFQAIGFIPVFLSPPLSIRLTLPSSHARSPSQPPHTHKHTLTLTGSHQAFRLNILGYPCIPPTSFTFRIDFVPLENPDIALCLRPHLMNSPEESDTLENKIVSTS